MAAERELHYCGRVQLPTPAAGTIEALKLTLTASATIGGSQVSLAGTSVGTPTLTLIAPANGLRGSNVDVTLTGTNFSTLGSTLSVSGSGVTVGNVNVVDATTITATFTIATGAATGARNVTVTTGGITTNAVSFTVQSPPPPTLSSISPASHTRGGGPVPVTLTGGNFVDGARVTVSGGVTVTAGGGRESHDDHGELFNPALHATRCEERHRDHNGGNQCACDLYG